MMKRHHLIYLVFITLSGCVHTTVDKSVHIYVAPGSLVISKVENISDTETVADMAAEAAIDLLP